MFYGEFHRSKLYRMSISVKNLMPLLFLFILLAANYQTHAEPITLADQGKSDYVVVLPDSYDATEQTAAKELQSNLEMSSHVLLPIMTESEAANRAQRIIIGRSKAFQAAYPEFDWVCLKNDGIVMRTQGQDIFLAGDHPRGTLYAVYTFLEEVVGFRWWRSNETFVPSKPTLEISELNKTYVPQLFFRDAYYRDVIYNPLFSVKLKLNGQVTEIPREYGGNCPILGFVHTFYNILPPAKYFKEHPEWYSFANGVRKEGWGQLCLTNSEMKKEFIKNTLKWISENPSAKIVSVSQNDGGTFCQCDNCRNQETKEGSPSGPVIYFVNDVAEEVEKAYPDVLVETLAYMETRKAPKFARPRKNVVIRLCTMECSFSQPLATGEQNIEFQRDMKDWSQISSQLLIWNYVTNFLSYIEPHPNIRSLGNDIRYFVKNKTVGLFEQGDSGSTCGDFPELRAWLLAHLMWDPTLDEEKLITEFLNGYYGQAAEPISQYIDLISDTVTKSGVPLWTFNEDTSKWFSYEAISQATELFDQAENKVKDDAIIFNRVRRARMPLDNVWLKRYEILKLQAKTSGLSFNGPKNMASFTQDFINRMRSFGNQSYREGYPSSIYELKLQKTYLASEIKLPKACKNLPESQYLIVEDGEFEYFRWGQFSLMVDDANASNGKAASTPSNHGEWALQYIFRDNKISGQWRCYADMRVDAKATNGPAFKLGIYDMTNKQSIVERTINIEELNKYSYTTIDIGLYEIAPQMHFYVVPCNNPDQVETIFLDRIFFVKSND